MTTGTGVHDVVDRLTKADDDACATRDHDFASAAGFDRTGLTTDASTTACAPAPRRHDTTAPASHTYESTDRISDCSSLTTRNRWRYWWPRA